MNNLLIEQYKPVSDTTARECRHALQTVIDQHLPKEICQRILLCLSEALTNLVTHAQAPSEIGFRFSQENDGWQLQILDDGEAWDPTLHLDDDLLTGFSDIESGRGVALLHAQSDNITYIKAHAMAASCKQYNQLQLFWSLPKIQSQQTILIVEDNASLRLLFKTYLANRYHIITASNGYQALEKLATKNIDLVLSDIRMPEMNGLTLRKKINQQNGSEIIPFVFLTGQDDEMVQDQAFELGVDDYLIKPVCKTKLVKIVQRILERSKQVYQRLTTRIDKQITNSLQPNIPILANGWRLHLATRNTGQGGGDLLLHHELDSKTQLLLTDIMGHDDSAKFFSHAYGGYLYGLLQSMSSKHGPEYMLEQLSHGAMTDNLLSQVTLTCCSLQLSPQGKINIATAGHPAPLLISDNKISCIETSGILPGLIKHCDYKNEKLTIKPGQRIAVFTDGLFESANDNASRTHLQEQINNALLKTLHLPITQALDNVMSLFDVITGQQPSDDTLLLLLEPIQF